MPEERGEEEENRGDRPLSADELAKLPQNLGEVWQVSTLRLPTWYADDDGELKRPQVAVVSSRTDDLLLKHDLPANEPSADWLWNTIVKAMADPAVGAPRRPGLLQVRSETDANLLRPHLKLFNIDCVVCDDLDQLDSAFAGLVEQLHGGRMSALVDMPGLSPEQLATYYEAAAYFYRQAPWRALDDVPIQIDCDKFDSGPWYAVVLGPAGETLGLMLYEDLDLLRQLDNGELSLDESSRIASAISVIFDQKHDLAFDDLDAIEKHGWSVAGPDAYPLAIRLSPGRAIRSLLAWELELVEACLRAIPHFAEAKPPGTKTIKIKAAGDELILRMRSFPLREAAPDESATGKPEPSATTGLSSEIRFRPLLIWAFTGALYGIIIGAVFNTSEAAVFASKIVAPISATLGTVLGARYDPSFNRHKRCSGGSLVWAVLIGVIGLMFGMLSTAMAVACFGAMAGCGAWWLIRSFLTKKSFLLLPCAAVGVVVQTWQWNASAAILGATYGGLVGAVGGILLLLLSTVAARLLLRDAKGGHPVATPTIHGLFGFMNELEE